MFISANQFHICLKENFFFAGSVYLTNMRTVNEIGISFAKKNICYLGEIILEQKGHLNCKFATS